MAVTPLDIRVNLFFPLLVQAANQAQHNRVEPARSIYRLLREQGAGDFKHNLDQLERYADLETYLEAIQQATSYEDRWRWATEAWAEFEGNERLRVVITKSIVAAYKHLQAHLVKISDLAEQNQA